MNLKREIHLKGLPLQQKRKMRRVKMTPYFKNQKMSKMKSLTLSRKREVEERKIMMKDLLVLIRLQKLIRQLKQLRLQGHQEQIEQLNLKNQENLNDLRILIKQLGRPRMLCKEGTVCVVQGLENRINQELVEMVKNQMMMILIIR